MDDRERRKERDDEPSVSTPLLLSVVACNYPKKTQFRRIASEPTAAMADAVTPAAIKPLSTAVVERAKFSNTAGLTWRLIEVIELCTIYASFEQRQLCGTGSLFGDKYFRSIKAGGYVGTRTWRQPPKKIQRNTMPIVCMPAIIETVTPAAINPDSTGLGARTAAELE